MPRKYSDKEKAEYYKKKYQQEAKRKPAPRRRSYKKKQSYQNTTGYNIGSSIGGYIAPGIGSRIGGGIGSGIQSMISGHGDYTVKSNALVYNRDAVPKFTNDRRCTILTHREFIKDIRSSVNFESSEFTVNPGDFKTFPWLSKIAQNYEEYIFQGIVFEFKTNSATSVASTNTALGTVCAASQYNTLAPSFSSKQQIENYEFANSSVPCSSFLHAIECDPMLGNEVKSIFNERDSNENADPRNYNLCRTTIATQGMQAESTIGELWVSYKVCLLKPRLGYNDNLADCFIQTVPVSATSIDPLGTELLVPSEKNAGIVTQPPSPNLNVFEVDPSFNGVMKFEVIYSTSVFSTIVTPYWSSADAEDVSLSYMGVSSFHQTRLDNTDQTQTVCVTAYYRFTGGYTSGGNPPSVVLISMTAVGVNFTNVRVNCITVPSQSVLPVFE